MRKFLLFFLCLNTWVFLAQNPNIAKDYYKSGDYEKALVMYESLYKQNRYNVDYLEKIVDCYQQLKKFEKAENTIRKHLKQFPSKIQLYVDLGYNYQLQGNKKSANSYYKQALKELDNNPYAAHGVGQKFHNKHLLDETIEAYKTAISNNPNPNYSIELAGIYGEKGDIESMFNSYLNLIALHEKYTNVIQQYLGRFISANKENEYNILLKNIILKRIQEAPNETWNKMLSWLYVQQEEYFKAFIQEKAIYKRNTQNLNRIISLGKSAFNQKDYSNAKRIFEFILNEETAQNTDITARLFIIQSNIGLKNDIEVIQKQFDAIFETYGNNNHTIAIQLVYCDFLRNEKQNPTEAIQILKKGLTYNISSIEEGRVKLKLGDILVSQNQFNDALIYYSQVQVNLKNHPLSQEARYKVAQTSFFKGDFEWAETQLKVLKASTSQLIANDALHLSLIISDNTIGDSIQTALKIYAKADLLAFQEKNSAAIDTLQELINDFTTHKIIDEALYKQATLYEAINQNEKAIVNYLQLIQDKENDLYIDDAYFRLGEIAVTENQYEKAKEYYQKIIFDYPSSIHLVEARKKYRKLRGDSIE